MTLKQGSKNKVFYQAEQGRGILGRRNNMAKARKSTRERELTWQRCLFGEGNGQGETNPKPRVLQYWAQWEAVGAM